MKQIKISRMLILFVIVFNAGIATVVWANFEFNPAPLISSNGQLRGAVLLSGKYQAPAPLKVVKSRSFCGLTVPNETLLVDRGGGVRNAVVILRPLDRNVNIHPGRILLDNKQCAFTPHVQIAGIGSELLLKNSDPILHTVHARLGNETLFNVGLPRWRQVSKVLDRLGVVRIDCDVLHTWMSAAIVVVSTPYVAVTGESGLFTIEDIPAGKYAAEIWHEVLGIKKTQISIPPSGAIFLDAIYGRIPEMKS
ncbi:MAG TPA: hypothetical protein VEO92_03825 [Candidatus Nitrosocosmicus sp.]|jgi:hypothetical protein|nr:hypothetical protein [Candidatus Nitrosocosmicus sp.]